jgi:signal peptidase I
MDAKAPAILREPGLAALLSLIPGLGHLWIGQSLRKSFLFLGISFVLFLTVVFGSMPSLAWMCLFSFHSWVVLDAYQAAGAGLGWTRPRGRAAVWASLIVSMLLGPLYLQASRSVTTLSLDTDAFAPLLRRDDRLLVRPQSEYRRGDIVFSSHYGGVERVVALAGDKVAVRDGRLYVNGEAAAGDLAPMNDSVLPLVEGAELPVPDGRYCVFFPSRSRYLSGDRLLSYYLIPADRLSGRVVLRYYPSWRSF